MSLDASTTRLNHSGRILLDLNTLLDEEIDELRRIHTAWLAAKDNKNYVEADRLRHELTMAGVRDEIWLPIFEYSLNRQRRAFIRMKTWQVDIYPWELRDV